MKLLLTNGNYVTIMCILGCSLGFFNALMTQVEEMLCARNYESWMTSAVSVAFLVPGFVGGGIQSFIAGKTGHMASVGKISYNVGLLFLLAFLLCLREYDSEVAIITLGSM